tara:strand:- start:726 stop:842 length:117 start_codon:yes stop_codon:yes gene_type:complete
MIDRKQERSDKFIRKKKFKQKGATPPKRKKRNINFKEE